MSDRVPSLFTEQLSITTDKELYVGEHSGRPISQVPFYISSALFSEVPVAFRKSMNVFFSRQSVWSLVVSIAAGFPRSEPNELRYPKALSIAENDKELYTDNYAQQLTRWGYEKMVLPKVRTLHCSAHCALLKWSYAHLCF